MPIFNWEALDLVDERIKSNQERAFALGTAQSATDKSTNTVNVMMDGSGVAVPCKAFRSLTVLPGARVGLAKFGTQWIVVGTYATHLGPVGVPDGVTRDAMWESTTAIPKGQQVFVNVTGELEIWTGAAWQGVRPRIVVRPVPQTKTSDTAMADDTYLKLPVEAAAKYRLKAFLSHDAGTVGDFRWGFGYPTGTAGFQSAGAGFFFIHPASVDTAQEPVFQEWTITDPGVVAGGESGAGAWRPVLAETLFTAGDDGEVALRWAQNVSESAGLTLGAGSYIEMLRVG